MSKRVRLGASFNLDDPEQRQAWEILFACPPRQRMYALARMICGYREQQELLEAIRTVIREELHSQPKPIQEQKNAGNIGSDVLGFLSALQRGDDVF